MPRRQRIKIGKIGKSVFAVRTKKGQFKDIVEIQRSIAVDKRVKAKRKVEPGYGHLGDLPKKRK
jgi:hypothetical protein